MANIINENNEAKEKKVLTLEERQENIAVSKMLARKAESKAIVLVKEHHPMETVDHWIHILETDATSEEGSVATYAKYQLFKMNIHPPKVTADEVRQEMLKNASLQALYETDRKAFNRKLKNRKSNLVRKLTAQARDKDIEQQIARGVNPPVQEVDICRNLSVA
jgi:aspartate/tyrosine/aromatic aminotransferase